MKNVYHYAPVAQGIEQRTSNPLAVGSIPTRRTIRAKRISKIIRSPFLFSNRKRKTLKMLGLKYRIKKIQGI